VSVALAAFLVSLLSLWATIQRPIRWQVPLLVLLVASSAVLAWAQPNGPGPVGVLLGFVLLGRLISGRLGVGLPLFAFVVLVVLDAVRATGPDPWFLVAFGGLFGMLFLAHRLAVANEQAEKLVMELQASRAAEAHAAGLAERQRLAREMHDVLAHSLSGLLLQLEGARMLAAEDPHEPRLAEAIDRAHHLARSGLDEARRAIETLRDDELPGPDRLAVLAEQFQADRGIPCRYTVDGEAHRLDPQARLALYRVAQEALTNITKHANPERVELHLAYGEDTVHLIIEDFAAANGARSAATPGDAGYGLTGMRERAELLGGTLTTRSTSCGFRVELDVPA
jgi:signal transduction histidine kinase